MRLKRFLVSTSLAISTFLWLPSQYKIVHTHSARDYNPWSFALILWLQISSFTVAKMDRSVGLMWYYVVNGANVAIMLALILVFGRA